MYVTYIHTLTCSQLHNYEVVLYAFTNPYHDVHTMIILLQRLPFQTYYMHHSCTFCSINKWTILP